MERSVLGVRIKDKIRLNKIKNVTKFKNVNKVWKTLKWKWAGHMIREKNEKWTKKILEWYPRNGKRCKGRPTKRWEDDLKRVAGPEWTRIARDRDRWKSLEEAFVEGQAVEGKTDCQLQLYFLTNCKTAIKSYFIFILLCVNSLKWLLR